MSYVTEKRPDLIVNPPDDKKDPCSGSKALIKDICERGKEADGNREKAAPDYWVVSGIIPFCPIIGFPVCGPAFSVYLDKYGNVYVGGGVGAGLPPTVSFGAGWFLAPDNDREEFAETFLQKHSFTVSGGGSPLGIGPGLGVNNNYPSYIQTNNEGSSKEHIAIEALITTTGGDGTGTYNILFYDKGDDTPWFWQDD